MCCSIENNLTLRKAVVLTTLLLVISAVSASCCYNCESRTTRERDGTQPTVRKLPSKKDIFMSRGWGAGGGSALSSRKKPDLYKKNRMVVEMMMGDDGKYEHLLEPRVEFLRSPDAPKLDASRRRLPVYVPQLFISSGWGPLGK